MSAYIVPVRFYDDTIEAVRGDDGKVWVSLRRCCENLGLDLEGQRKKLKSKSWACAEEKSVQTSGDDQTRLMTMIDLDTLPGWLFSIDERKVKPEARKKIVQYQKECSQVLREHFFGKVVAKPSTGDDVLDSIECVRDALASIAETRRRQLELAKQQAELAKQQAETRQIAERAGRVAAAALHQSESNLGYFSVIGYGRLTGREMTSGVASAHGRRLGEMCRNRGLRIGSITDARHGYVHTYPESILIEYFGDNSGEPVSLPSRN